MYKEIRNYLPSKKEKQSQYSLDLVYLVLWKDTRMVGVP